MNGGNGDDLLVGGKGKDKLIGGKGKYIFKLSTGYGYDLIQDFKNNQDNYKSSIYNNLLKFINPNKEKIKNTELEYGNKRIESYIFKGTIFSNKIRVYLDNITRELNQYSILDFKKIIKNIIPLPDSLSKKQFVNSKYIEIDTLRFFSVELLNLSSYNCYRLISIDIINMKDDEFIENYIPSNNIVTVSYTHLRAHET